MYIIANEVTELFKVGFGYFLSVWNYLDVIPPIMILLFMIFDRINYFVNYAYVRTSMQAIMSLLIWLKFLYFLRMFDSTGYLIRIIV